MAAPDLLGAFALLVLLVTLTPGADMLMVLSASLTGGRPGGLAAVAGIAGGVAIHILVVAIGIGALIAVAPFALRGLGLAGGTYLVFVGLRQVHDARRFAVAFAAGSARPSAAFKRALTINLLNPKAYLFVLAVLPQFVRADGWPGWLQTLILGAFMLTVAILIYGSLALAASRHGPRLLRNEAALRGVQIGAGILLALLGAGLFASQLHGA